MEPDTLVVTGATALAGESLEQIDDAVIVVRGESIASVGTRVAGDPPPGAHTIAAPGLVFLPGFIDAHVHIGFAEPREVLQRGVTTVRDLGWPPDIIFSWAERSRAPSFEGPEILAAGPMLTVTGGYPQRAAWAPEGTGHALASPQQAAGVVASLARRGATVIKVALNPSVGPVLDHDTLTAVVAAAHEHDLAVTGHVTGLEELHKALGAGVDELAHMLMSNEVIPDETLDVMVRAGMTIVPTLSIRSGDDLATAIGNLRRFLDRGGDVVYGTDLGNEGPGPGIDPLEVNAMARAGMSARDVIASATTRAAARLGLGDRGVLAPGRLADFIAVPRAALEDPSALTRVQMVFRRGRRVA